jgi:hypothetical protein
MPSQSLVSWWEAKCTRLALRAILYKQHSVARLTAHRLDPDGVLKLFDGRLG